MYSSLISTTRHLYHGGPRRASDVVDVEASGAAGGQVVDEGAAGRAVVGRPVGVGEVDLQDRVVGAGDQADDRGPDPEVDRLALVGGPVLDAGPGADVVGDPDVGGVGVPVGAGERRPVQL